MNTGSFKAIRNKWVLLAVTALMATMAFAQSAFACSAPTGGCYILEAQEASIL